MGNNKIDGFLNPRNQDGEGKQGADLRPYLDQAAATVADLNAGELPPEHCPADFLQGYVTQVLEAGLSPEDALDNHLLPLLEQGWYQAWCAQEGHYQGYLEDLRRIKISLRQANATRSAPPYRISQEIRCRLLQTSVFSYIKHIPPELLLALVDEGAWSLQRVLNLIPLMPDRELRAQTYIGLVERLDDKARLQCLHKALDATMMIKDEHERTRALTAIARQSAGESHFLRQALTSASSVDNEWIRAEALSAIVEQLTGPALLRQAFKAALTIKDPCYFAWVLAAIAGQSQGNTRQWYLKRALNAAKASVEELYQSTALAVVVKQLTDEPALLRKSLDHAIAIHNEADRAYALAAMATPLRNTPALLDKAFAAASAIHGPTHRAEALTAIARQLHSVPRQRCLGQALAAIDAIDDANERAHGLTEIAEQLHGAAREQCLRKALDAADKIPAPGPQALTLFNIAEQSATVPALLQQTLAATANTCFHRVDRAETLTAVVGQLHGAAQEQCLHQALEAIDAVDEKRIRAQILVELAGHFQGKARQQYLHQALETATVIDDEADDIAAILAAGISPSKGNAPSRSWQEIAEDAIAATEEPTTEPEIAPKPPGSEDRTQCLRQALDNANTIENEWDRAHALQGVAAHLKYEPAFLNQVLDAANAIEDELCRCDLLPAIAVHLTEPAHLSQVMDAANAIQDDWNRADALTDIAKQVQGTLRQQCLGQALDAASAIEVGFCRARALTILAEQLHGEPALWRRTLQEAQKLPKGTMRSDLALSLTRTWDTSLGYKELAQLFDTVGMVNRANWLVLITFLAPAIHRLGGETAMEETVKAIYDAARWWP